MNGYDIIILAGQSNAEGSGLGKVFKNYEPNPQIMELSDKNPAAICDTDIIKGGLQLTKPYEFVVEQATEKPYQGKLRGNLAHSFAEEYIKAGYLREGRKVLIVKAAVGGSGFARLQWGKGTELSNRMFEMVDYALGLEKDSKVVAMLWHQGEHDAFEHEELTPKTKESFYFDKFNYLINETIKRYGKFPVLAAGFTDEWSKDYVEPCNAVIRATKKVLNAYGGGFIPTRGLKSNNQNSGNGDTIHFCRSALYKLGKKYFDKFKEINKRGAKCD